MAKKLNKKKKWQKEQVETFTANAQKYMVR
jgi:hypothetical protein